MSGIDEIVGYSRGSYNHMDDQDDWIHPQELNTVNNVKSAMALLGHDISQGEAKSIWELYSMSCQAGWMMGGDTILDAKNVLECFFANIDSGEITRDYLDIEITWPSIN
jgi:hypothetical protein